MEIVLQTHFDNRFFCQEKIAITKNKISFSERKKLAFGKIQVPTTLGYKNLSSPNKCNGNLIRFACLNLISLEPFWNGKAGIIFFFTSRNFKSLKTYSIGAKPTQFH